MSGRMTAPCIALTVFAAAVAPGAAAADAPFDLAAAIAAARPGDTIRVPPGVYRGHVVIDKPLTLEAEPGAVLDGGEEGDVVQIRAPRVTLRGFIIRGTGISLDRENAGVTVLAPQATIENNRLEDVLFGIYLKQAPESLVRGNTIVGKDLPLPRRGDAIRVWSSHNTTVAHNDVRAARDVVMWFSQNLRLVGNRVRDGRYGLHFMYSDDNVIEDNILEDNSVGAFLMYSRRLVLRNNTFARNRGPSGYGVGLKDMDTVHATGNLFLGNRVGLYIDNSPWSRDAYDEFRENVFAYNDIGIAFQPSVKRNIFTGNTFLENIEQVAILGAGEFSGNVFTVNGRGNFWSDYRGYDLDGDGLGDLPYRPVSLFENLMDREPKLRLLLFSPAQQAVEMAARIVPLVQPQPKLTDTAPLMAPVAVAAVPDRTGNTSLAWLPAIALLVAGTALALGGSRSITPSTHRRAPHTTPPDSAPTGVPASPAAPARAPVLEVRALTKRYGRIIAADNVTFSLRPGEALALWGANGAGKTTVVRCVLGLVPFTGHAAVGGWDVRAAGKRARLLIGYVPQELALYDELRTAEVLAFFARLKRCPPAEVARVLAAAELTDQARKRVRELSGGMKQRLALAVALLADPPLLILDEPTSNLDAAARQAFLAMLRRLRDSGKAVLFSTHRMDEVLALADRALALEAGRIVADCPARELPRHLGRPVALRLLLEEGQRDRGLAVLREAGFDPIGNGQAVVVPVDPHAKAEPIRALHDAGVRVRDFDIHGEPNDA